MSEKFREIDEICTQLDVDNRLDYDYDYELCVEEHIKDLESDY